ncbi:hypothetical protein DTO169E5_6037 [Paecilomyces variotii]|nr:hypothetical protein DTO169E5_6037 [Paecilomyces variotii]
MGWSNTSYNRWERPLDGLEGYFVVAGAFSGSLCDGRQHYVLYSKLTIETGLTDMESALKHAWTQLRYKQPQIAATVEGMKLVYEVPDETSLQEWVTSTFIVSSASDAEELYRKATPIKQATLYYIPKSSELVFRAHHYLIDGTGVLLFWHRYLSALTAPTQDIKFGDEHTRLAPTTEEILGYPEQAEKDEKVRTLVTDWFDSFPGIGPVSKVGTALSGQCQHTELVFPSNMTEAIVKACKDIGVTLTAAIHAAYIQMLVKHGDPNFKSSQYVTANQFNLRPYLPEPYCTSTYAVSVYYTPFAFRMDLPSSFWDTAYLLDNHYKNTFKGNPDNLGLKEPFTRSMFDAVQTPEFAEKPISRDALVSSLGIVERHLQRTYGDAFVVKDVKIGVDVVLGMSMFFVYTFRDSLRLVYSFNDGYESPSDIQTYLDEIQRILVEELAV